MAQVKRNKSIRKVGHSRGVPLRLLRAIARKYSLTHIVALTADKQKRARALYWAMSEVRATQLAAFCVKLEKELGWETIYDWDCSSVRRLKERIKHLERQMALIFEREGDPREIARVALNLPVDV
jgi:hypothetical protein